MSERRAIDGDDSVFAFDAFETAEELAVGREPLSTNPDLSDMSHIPQFCHLDMSAYSASTPAEVVDFLTRTTQTYNHIYEEEDLDAVSSFKGKGKASQPLDIVSRETNDMQFDDFSYCNLTGAIDEFRLVSEPSSSTSTPQTLASFAFSSVASPTSMRSQFVSTSYNTDITNPESYGCENEAETRGDVSDVEIIGKGKARAETCLAPCLPPLSFSPSTYAHGETNWPAELPVESIDVDARFSSSTTTVESPPSSPPPSSEPVEAASALLVALENAHRVPIRTRSVSSLSSRSTKSLAASFSKLRANLAKGKQASQVARKLLLRNRGGEEFEDNQYSDREVLPHSANLSNSSFTYTSKTFSRPGASKKEKHRRQSLPINHTIHSESGYTFGANGDIITGDFFSTTTELWTRILPNYFDVKLPKELRILVFQALLELHEIDDERMRRSEDWSALKASRKEYRWSGRSKGFVELVRISRVCKSWQETVFDGQLWSDLNLKAFPTMPPYLLTRLAALSGSFVRGIDLTGHTRLISSSLTEATKTFCIPPSGKNFNTQLTTINLSGCTKLSSHALQGLILRSPRLVSLTLRGLPAVTNATCAVLAKSCPLLESVDLSRCRNMDANGLIILVSSSERNGAVSALRVLRLAGILGMDDDAMALLGSNAPNLEVLDLSNARELRNSALDAFVSCSEGEDADEGSPIVLSSRDLGYSPGDTTKYYRRVTKLRHLVLSSCPLLSDVALSNLVHSVPKLEFLEMAGIGPDIRDDGLVRLLKTTPLIRRIDLEEASDISDATLAAITPLLDDGEEVMDGSKIQPGCYLEQLSISYAAGITNEALSNLIKACTKLRCLEVDNTRITGATVREFVRTCRRRELVDTHIVAVDCRSVGETTVKELSDVTRTRKGWRGFDARRLNYLDLRDKEQLGGVGKDECDETKVALKTFYSWQTVDAVEAARVKRRNAKKKVRGEDGDEDFLKRTSSKWWSPGARRGSGSISPPFGGFNDRDGCIIM